MLISRIRVMSNYISKIPMTFPAKNTDILFPYHLLCAVSLSQVCREALSKAAWIDHYKETHGIFPQKPKPLFTEEEFKKYRDSFYEGTDAEGMNPEDLVPGNPYDKYVIDDYSPASDVED